MSEIAEQHIIGALLIDLDCISQIYDDVIPQMFHNELYAFIYKECLSAYIIGESVNLVTLSQKLQSDVYTPSAIREAIAECMSTTVTTVQIKSYADVIIKEYKANALSHIINRIKPIPDKIYEQIDSILVELEQLRKMEKSKIKRMDQIVDEYSKNYFCESIKDVIHTGFTKIDNAIGGLEGGDVIVIGARPAVGKSAFMAQIAKNIAKNGKKVALYNLEMSDKQEYERFLSNSSGIDIYRIRNGVSFLNDEKDKFIKTNDELRKLPIYLRSGSVTPKQIKSEIKYLGIDVVIIDYLQLVKSDQSYGNRYMEVGSVSKAIKEIAMDFSIPIIELSQLNRASGGSPCKKPTMAELREAGDIEQDASIIMLMWNREEDDRTFKGLVIDKNRQGKTLEVDLKFSGDTMQFKEEKYVKSRFKKKVEEETPFD